MQEESQHCTAEDTSNGLLSTNQASTRSFSESKPIASMPESESSQNQRIACVKDDGSSAAIKLPELREKGTPPLPISSRSTPYSKLVIPPSLLFSGIDGSPYNLDSLRVPFVTKAAAPGENAPVDVQNPPGSPQSSEGTDTGEAAPKTPLNDDHCTSQNPSDSPAASAPLPQDGTPSEQAGGGWTQDGVFIPMYSRKEKSLGLLCDNFLRLFSNEQETWGGVCLDSAAKKLHVERRRIYDIVNVLESVEIVARRAKNKYAWYGMTRLPQAIERLRTATLAELNQEPAERHAAEAELASKSAMPVSRDVGHDPSFLNNAGPSSQADAEKSRESVVSASACECEKNQNEVEGSAVAVNSGVDQVAQLSTVTPCADALIETDSQSRAAVKVANLENPTDACSTEDESCPEKLPIPTALSQEPPPAGCEVPPKSTIIPGVADSTYYAFLEMYRMQKASRREKSLGVLSQKFVQLFLNSEHGVVSLEPAARRLLEEDTFNDEGQLKTKIRRLYDIANILCSLNLIEKTSSSELHRKPAFKWIYDPTKTDHRFRNVDPEAPQKPITPIKTTPKPEKKVKEPKPVKQPREPKPPKEKKEKGLRKARKLDSDSSAPAAASNIHSGNADLQLASDPSAFPLSPDIFQQLPYLQQLLQFSMTNPVSAQAIIQGNPAIMSMLANPVLMNLLAMSTSYVNSFMSASAVPNYGYPDTMANFGPSGMMAPPMGVPASSFYVPPINPSVLTEFMLSPDFSSVNSNPVSISASASVQEPSEPIVKMEHNQNEAS